MLRLVVCAAVGVDDRGVRFGRWRITVERSGGREWFRLQLGRSVVADRLPTVEALERELARYGLTLADFEEDPVNDE